MTSTVLTVLSRRYEADYRSVPMEHLLEEAQNRWQTQGVKELILVAQETTMYGTDLYGEKRLPQLLQRALQDQRTSAGSVFCTAIRRRSPMS